MFDSVHKAVRNTKKFVTNHPTVAACAVTAVITAKITKSRVETAQLEEIKHYMYNLGYEQGGDDVRHWILATFVHDKGLQDDLDQFTREMFSKAA